MELRWTLSPESPRAGDELTLTLLLSQYGEPLAGAAVEVQGHMTHPGMVPVIAAAREVDAGRYRASLELTMAGDWVLLIEVALAEGGSVRREIPLPGVPAP